MGEHGPDKGISVSDFVASDSPYLCKEQIAPYGVVLGVVERVTRSEVAIRGTSRTEPKFVVWFRGWKKGLVVGSRRNRTFLADLFGGVNTKAWTGKSVYLYVDSGAKFGRDVTGGVRFAWGTKFSGETMGPPKPTPINGAAAPAVDPSDVPVDAPDREPGDDASEGEP